MKPSIRRLMPKLLDEAQRASGLLSDDAFTRLVPEFLEDEVMEAMQASGEWTRLPEGFALRAEAPLEEE